MPILQIKSELRTISKHCLIEVCPASFKRILPLAMISYIDKKECSELLKSREDVQIIDLRDAIDFELGHIPGAMHLDVLKNGSYQKLENLSREKAYLFYCNSGLRSNSIARIIDGLGFKSVFMLKEGINDWDWQLVPD